MPTYLLHGFRWPRPLVRIHIILQNLDDAAAEWLMAPLTTSTMLENLESLYPEPMSHLPGLRFIEQYDPSDITPGAGSQPYAYVADIVEEVKLGVCIDEVTTRGIGNDAWSACLELRDRLAPEEKVGWFVVVCGDEERWAPSTSTQLEQQGLRSESLQRSDEGYSDSDGKVPLPPEEPEPRGLRRFFGSRSQRKTVKSTGRPPMPNMPRSHSSSDLTSGRAVQPPTTKTVPPMPRNAA
ncbi:hypothetical protein LTR62_008232 [Meristemomyces frigidus]|uniref:Uncharacterized protein n=1 Tax=Meristemomyces frigidus TaxID=1508187 RepID=A0AAN7YCY4_9PEZI|nr:hypothetical protein LTR62_008232 [Meristemomyces frigidus]